MTHNPIMSRERVVVPDRPTPTKQQKVACWNRENGICWWCGKPVAAMGPGVEYDHKLPRELSANDDPSNIYPMHAQPCHLRKTREEDRPAITKAHHQGKLTQAKVRSKRPIPAHVDPWGKKWRSR